MTLDTDEQLEKYLEGLESESKAIREEALRFTWWMRGGISYEDAMALNKDDNEIIRQIIKENMETTKQSGMPFF